MYEVRLRERLDSLPTKPGVYLMKDEAGQVIYVGKAVNLRNRVRSYFHASAMHPPKVQRLVERIADVEFIVTDSEVEALILEANLIKKYRPRYNVRLKDDKRYPYIKVTWQEDYPRVYVVRRVEQDGARYYGPFTASWAVHETLDLLRKLFPYVTCRRPFTGKAKRACLYYHIGLCPGPCIGAISKEEYRAGIEQLCLFLEGKADRLIRSLREGMMAAAEALEFERAARLRDQLQAVERVVQRQKVVLPGGGDQDVIALARDDGLACVQVFLVREGRLVGREYFLLEGTEGEGVGHVLSSFLQQFYQGASYIPPEILLPEPAEEAEVLEEWLRARRGGKVALRVPRRGRKRELVALAATNARETLASLRAAWESEAARSVSALAELQEALEMTRAPARIEGYDISDIQGTAATGSMVVFVQGKPRKSHYRRFRIKTVEGADDYAMMREVLRRRFQRAMEEQPLGTRQASAWKTLPDLVLVDGGKGQLGVAVEVLREFGLEEQVAVIALAKEREEVFLPGRPEPLRLPPDSPALHLLQRIRDEAHRFAVAYHRRMREKKALASLLEEIPGIGPKRRKALLQRFGSLEAIRAASLEELASLPGMTREAARRVKENL